MASFFDKLKKGMGVEVSLGEDNEATMTEEEEIATPKKVKARKTARRKPTLSMETKKLELKKEEPEEKIIQEENSIKEIPITDSSGGAKATSKKSTIESKEKWGGFSRDTAGQLAIDVYQTSDELVIQSAIAGVKPETLDITIEKDVVTIKGAREKPFEETGDYFSQECYWGPFFREVILPAEADPNRVAAEMKDGILTIRIPRIIREKKRKITVRGG